MANMHDFETAILWLKQYEGDGGPVHIRILRTQAYLEREIEKREKTSRNRQAKLRQARFDVV